MLLKLEALRELGTLNLEKETLKSLRTVLQNADLVKFAKSLPEVRHADADRKAIKAIVIATELQRVRGPHQTAPQPIKGFVWFGLSYRCGAKVLGEARNAYYRFVLECLRFVGNGIGM